MQVVSTGGSTGRGVVAREAIAKSSYVCEYKTSAVYSAKDKSEYENVHEMNSAGSHVLEPVPKVGRLCFDATERFHHPGWYINHIARGGNVRLNRPFFIRGKWHIGFLAIRHINVGEELAYDYLDRDKEQQWLQEGRLVDHTTKPALHPNNSPSPLWPYLQYRPITAPVFRRAGRWLWI